MNPVRAWSRSPVLWKVRRRAGDWYHSRYDRGLLALRHAAREIDGRPGRVLYFGESSLLHVGPDDVDKRRLSEMVDGLVGPALTIVPFVAPAFNPRLFAAAIRALTTLEHRPEAVILPLCIRTAGATQVALHPVFGYAESAARIDALAPLRHRIDTRRRWPEPDRAAYAAFEAMPLTTRWGLATSVGQARRDLKGYVPDRESVERQRLLFDYFHGEDARHQPTMAWWSDLGAALRDYRVPVLTYRTPVPTEIGTRLLGSEFVEHVERNYRAIESALTDAGLRVHQVCLEPTSDAGFIEPAGGTEHMTDLGRRPIAEALAAALRATVSGSVSTRP